MGKKKTDTDKPNGEIQASDIIMKNVMKTASEEEYENLYRNSKIGVSLQNTWQEMRFPQKETPLITDNSTASGIINKSIQIKNNVQWKCASTGLQTVVNKTVQSVQVTRKYKYGGLLKKNHTPSHLQNTRPVYLVNAIQ